MVVQNQITMKNLNVIANGLKSISNAEASAILEELQSPEKIMCIFAVHIDDDGEESNEYSWQVPEYLWGEIEINLFVEVENCGNTAAVKVVEIFWVTPEEAAHNSSVIKVDRLRLQKPLIYLEGLKPVWCWYQKDVPSGTIFYTSFRDVKVVLKKAADIGVLSLYSFQVLTGACTRGIEDFLYEHARFLYVQADAFLHWGQEIYDIEECHTPHKLTPEFLELATNRCNYQPL
jgi:hypothetical protein